MPRAPPPLVGIDVARYSAIAFAAGGALAAIAGILLSSFVGINPTIGAAFTMKALIVVVMGGIGHVLGGLVAGLVLGLAETMAALLLDPGLITVINFAIFSIVLLWRPQGLFGGGARSDQRGAFRLPKPPQCGRLSFSRHSLAPAQAADMARRGNKPLSDLSEPPRARRGNRAGSPRATPMERTQ